MSREYKVAIVGATGVVGNEMRKILETRDFPVTELRLLASDRSAGKLLHWRGSEIAVEVLNENSFRGIDFALFSAGSETSREYAPIARDAGAVVIDNSSAWRMDPDIPLIVPEVNPGALRGHGGIIANPNCSTIQMVVALKPLHDSWGIKRVIVSTYQAVSGTGKNAIDELFEETRAALDGHDYRPSVYPHPIAFNLFPHIDVFEESGYSKEEIKMMDETRKIMGLPELRITATTVRVPIVAGHSESVNVEFERAFDLAEVTAILAAAPGIAILDEPSRNIYPTPLAAAGTDPCYVGRLRRDDSVDNGLNFWVVADNLRKGAALNAVQIAEHLVYED
jgi:aspartate-semialdehyde dehydrogenase